MNNKEIDYEGWLVKSPPSKRIWRARWRRRWFTLKQGEIPGQFCLEYYTDQNCRKLKGVIDLDQCEQVDSGLHLKHRKQNFHYMFDIKTPHRTYYLAADTESDMRDWVNCICQVCNLHDFTKPTNPERPYYNVLQADAQLPEVYTTNSMTSSGQTAISNKNDTSSTDTTTTSLNNSSTYQQQSGNLNNTVPPTVNVSDLIRQTDQLSINNAYQNNDFPYVNTEYTNRETVVFDSLMTDYAKSESAIQISKPQTLKATQSMTMPSILTGGINENDQRIFKENGDIGAATIQFNHGKKTTNEPNSSSSRTVISSSGVIKKIPENLVLKGSFVESNVEPSPALSTSSGPYIPISECFSGSPKFLNDADNPTTPLNNLDPKFYDTPRSRNNIGLNLTNDQSHSPKITNFSQISGRPRSGQYSPTDSESGFTDEDDWAHLDRANKPSDISGDSELEFTYSQRFSKVDDRGFADHKKDRISSKNTSERIQKRKNRLILGSKSEDDKMLRDFPQFSDTENTSPAIGPKDANSWLKENTNSLQYYNMNQLKDNPMSPDNPIAASTPNLHAYLSSDGSLRHDHSRTMPRSTKIHGNVFTFPDKPPVNRELKPKGIFEDKSPAELPARPSIATKPQTIPEAVPFKPPSIDRKLKPTKPPELQKPSSITRRINGHPVSVCLSSNSDMTINHQKHLTRTLPRTSSMSFTTNNNSNPIYNNSNNNNLIRSNTYTTPTMTSITPAPIATNHQLEYTLLDFESIPKTDHNIRKNSIGNSSLNSSILSGDISLRPPQPTTSGVIYSFVDRVKTEAVKQMCQDVQKTRMKN